MNGLLYWLVILFFGFANQTSIAAVPDVDSGREYAEKVLLFSGKEADMRFGINSIYKRDTINPATLDLLAEMAWAACNDKQSIKPDTLAWIAKTIGKSRQGRYAQLIDDCLGKVTNKSLIKHLNEAKIVLADSPRTNPFVGGTLNLDSVRADLVKHRKVVSDSPLARTQFESLKSRQRMDDVYSRFGAPEKVSPLSIPRGKAGFMYVKITLSDDRVVFHYPALGDVRFGYDEPTGNWLLADATSRHGLYWLVKDGRFVSTSVVVAEGDREDLLQITKLLVRQKEPIEAALYDRIADRIYLSQKENDGGMADTLAHMCKLLGKSNDGKYKQLLQEVSVKAAHGTLRKYAALVANALPDTSGQPYSPLKGANL